MKKSLIFLLLIFSFIFHCSKTPNEPASYTLNLKYVGQKTSQTDTAGKLYLEGNIPGDLEMGTFLSHVTGVSQTGAMQIRFTMNLQRGTLITDGTFTIDMMTGAITGSGTISSGTNRYAQATGSYTETTQMLSTTNVSGFLSLIIKE